MKSLLRISLALQILALSMVLKPSVGLAQEIPTDEDKQAGYCMQAEFDFAGRETRLIQLLQNNIKVANSELARTDLEPSDKAKMSDTISYADNKIPEAKADGKFHMSKLDKIFDYLKKRGLFDGQAIKGVTEDGFRAQKDEQEEQTIYRTCLSTCVPEDGGCKSSCDNKATSSEPNKRLLSCDAFADSLPNLK